MDSGRKIELIIDTREQKMIERVKRKIESQPDNSTIVRVEKLDVGDYRIDVNGVPTIILERKTIPDLISSYFGKGNRIFKQRQELIKIQEYYREKGIFVIVGFLIEGKLSSKESVDAICRIKKTLHYVNAEFIQERIEGIRSTYGLTLYETRDSEGTANTVLNLCNNYQKNGSVTEKRNESVLFNKSSCKIKEDLPCARMISQLKNVSAELARAIDLKYNSIANLIKEYEAINDEVKRENFFVNFTYVSSKNKEIKIQKALSKRIYHSLYSIDSNETSNKKTTNKTVTNKKRKINEVSNSKEREKKLNSNPKSKSKSKSNSNSNSKSKRRRKSNNGPKIDKSQTKLTFPKTDNYVIEIF